jgi:L-threonate 2-dehydrogenase
MPPTDVGFVGLGTMGAAMAARLLAAGHTVHGFDVRAAAVTRFAERGGRPARDAADAARDLLVIMVHDAEQVENVLCGHAGALESLRPGATVWLASTVAPSYARDLGTRLDEAGVTLVDGPVSGGLAGATAGTLTVIAGGDPAVLDRARPVMAACAARVCRVGGVGAGSTVKLINQVLTAAHIALTAEALALAARAGVDPRLVVDVVSSSAGTSRQFETRSPAMLAGDHTPTATVRTFLKDLGIAQDVAAELDFPMPLAAATNRVFTMAAEAGHADDGDTAVLRVYEDAAGVTVSAP